MVSGKNNYYSESPGFGQQGKSYGTIEDIYDLTVIWPISLRKCVGSYNGVLGITLDKTEQWGFLTSAEGKKIRTLNLQTTQVGGDITGIYFT